MVVLRIGQREWKGTDAVAEVAEVDGDDVVCGAPGAAFAQMDGVEPNAGVHDFVGEPELLVELEGARVDDHGARVLSRPVVVVDQTQGNAAAGEAQRQREAGWPGADDQDL